MTGIIVSKMYGSLGPYGFIRGADGTDRIFVPSSILGMDEASRDDQIAAFERLELKTRVEFTHADSKRGPRAIGVSVSSVDLSDVS